LRISAAPPPPFEATVIEADDELLAGFESVELADSVIIPLFVIVVPAVPAFTVAVIASVAVELAGMSPMVQIPVELA
jgi:hypothetical protein